MGQDNRNGNNPSYYEDDWTRRTNDAYTPRHARPEEPAAPSRGRAQQPPYRGRAQEPQPRSRAQEPPYRGRVQEPQARSRAQQPPSRGRAPQPRTWEEERRRGGRAGKGNSFSAPIVILLVVLILGVAVAGYMLVSNFLSYRRDRKDYGDLADRAVAVISVPEAREEETAYIDPEADEPVVSQIPIQVDWDYLRSINPDVVGWLYCPDTVINYPVVQTDNHEFYLTHGFDQTSNGSGTLFVDMDSVADTLLSNYIIYGHNMKDGSMFAMIHGYANESYYEEHPIMYYLTPTNNYRVDLFCAHPVSSDLSNFPTYFGSNGDYQSYIDSISTSCYWLDEDKISTDYQMITFSTCTYGTQYKDARLLLHGSMVPIY